MGPPRASAPYAAGSSRAPSPPRGLALCLCLVAVVAVLGSAGAEARSRRPQLVPATYSQKVDSLGFNWDINVNTGQINHGTN